MIGSKSSTAKDLYEGIKASLAPVFGEKESAALAQTLLEERLGLTRTDVLVKKEIEVLHDQRGKLENDVQRILSHEPIQYVVGRTEFYGRQFLVKSGVLIPRPETEELVDLIVKDNELTAARILDIGTGSGCIAISLAAEIPKANVSGWDVSQEALLIARTNSENLGCKVSFVETDILKTKVKGLDFDIIVSNPPYVLENEKTLMQPNVLEHEPDLALFVNDNDPLKFYRLICAFASNNLDARGHLYFEINEAFGAATEQLMESHGFDQVEVLKDLNGKDRMARGLWIPKN